MPILKEIVILTPLTHFKLMDHAHTLPATGTLCITAQHYVYLDIHDDYIHHLFPYLKATPAEKPPYFGEQIAGAHISVIYPEEKGRLEKTAAGQKHFFTLKGAYSADLGNKRYYVLLVNAPTLAALRLKAKLSELLAFKNHFIPFHITIGVCTLPL